MLNREALLNLIQPEALVQIFVRCYQIEIEVRAGHIMEPPRLMSINRGERVRLPASVNT
jgi:hypothetical protein